MYRMSSGKKLTGFEESKEIISLGNNKPLEARGLDY